MPRIIIRQLPDIQRDFMPCEICTVNLADVVRFYFPHDDSALDVEMTHYCNDCYDKTFPDGEEKE